ncbi:MAG: uracil-DNA glycosylase [Alphaproteobacteria bacterium]|nr:uracil-DNA glycosylase [Alphaproteobacteria bacterium]
MDNIERILDWYLTAGVDEICADEPLHALNTKETTDTAQIPHVDNLAEGIIKVRPAVSNLSQINSAARNSADEICKKAQTLDDLRAMVEEFDGCSLKFSANSTVFGYGNPQAEVLIIGEAPGADEDRLGEPFVGRSGHLLDKMLMAINLRREDCYITNILPWRPPGNRTPTSEEVTVCLPFLQRQIELINPKIIFILGRSAANALLDNADSISALRGHFIDYTTSKGVVIPTLSSFHPAYLLRTASQKAKAWADLLRLKRKLNEL